MPKRATKKMNRFRAWLWTFWICLNPSSSSSSSSSPAEPRILCPRTMDGQLCLLSTDGLALLRVRCEGTAAGLISPSQTTAISASDPGTTSTVLIENKGITLSPDDYPGSVDPIDRSIIASFNLTLSSCGRGTPGTVDTVVEPGGERETRGTESVRGSVHASPPTTAPNILYDSYRLNLSYFGIGDLDGEVFSGRDARYLEEIDLSGNWIRVLNLTVFAPVRLLQFINVSRNHLAYFEQHNGSATELVNVRTLDVSANRLKEVPSRQLTGLAQLQSLNISRNLVSTIDRKDITNLPDSLSYLDVGHNQIAELATGVFRCVGIKHLDLSHNLLTTLSNYTFVNLHSLATIDLSHNSIKDLEVDAFFTWDGGRCVDVENFTIGSPNQSDPVATPEGCSINRWPSLERLDLSHNELVTIRDNTFRTALCGVRELYLGYNHISHLPRYVIEQLRCLTIIDLQHNEIFWLDVGIFTNPSLRSVNLSFNKLRKVISMAFLYLPSVLNIDLSYNEIGYIYKYAFYRLCKDDRRSIAISLRGNRLQTDGLWKMMSVFQHQESSACAVDVDLRDNQVTHFLGDAVKQVRKEITLVELKRFEQWQRVTVELAGNDVRCDCSTASELSMLTFIDRAFQFGNSSLTRNLERWKLLNCSEEDHTGLSVMDFLDVNHCPDLAKFSCPAACDCRANRHTGVKFVNCSNRGLVEFPSFPIENRTDLDLSHNELTELRPSDEMRLQYLRSINLSHNRLRIISLEAVLQLSAVEEIFLDNNELESVPVEIADSPQLVNLTLRGNPLSCACHEVWIPEVVLRMRHVISDFPIVRCSSGAELWKSVSNRESVCGRLFELFSGEKLNRSSSRILIVLVGILPIAGVAIVVTVYRSQRRASSSSVMRDENGLWSRVDVTGSMDIFLPYCPSDEDWIRNFLLDIIWNHFPRCVIRFSCDLEPPEKLSHFIDESKVTLLVASSDFFRGSWKVESYSATILEKMETSLYGHFMVIVRGSPDDLDAPVHQGQWNKVTKLMADEDSCFAHNLIQCLSLTLGNTTGKYERVFVDDSEEEDQKLEKY